MRGSEPAVWIAHSEADRDVARRVAEWLDRQMITVRNDYVEYRLRSGEDQADVVTESISSADHVVVLVSTSTVPDDLVSQMRRAKALMKPMTVLMMESAGVASPSVTSVELVELMSGCPHVYNAAGRTTIDLIERIKCVQPYIGLPERHRGGHAQPFDVFISKKSEDFPLAKEVFEFLCSRELRVFLSEESLPQMGSADYMKAIDSALEQAKHLVVVGSRVENLLAGWVEAEWRVFVNEKRSGRKTGNVVTVVSGGLTPERLPMSLRYYEVVTLTRDGLDRLARYVDQG